MRNEFVEWVEGYPKQPIHRDPGFAGSPLEPLLAKRLPSAIQAAVVPARSYLVEGSIGTGTWSHAPWVALMDRDVTTTVQEGLYVVYLLSHGCERLYLALAQGCTLLKNGSTVSKAKSELHRRVALMRSRLEGSWSRLQPMDITLGSRGWRCELYEASVVGGIEYQANSLPTESELQADLEEALALYRRLWIAGGADAEDRIIEEAGRDIGTKNLKHAQRYRQHRGIERQASHSKEVKRVQGTLCRGCSKDMADRYGEVAQGLIDAHHLTPLSKLEDGQVAHFNAETDFAVLCPNCHRVIHRMPDASDVAGLRELVAGGKGA